MDINQRETLKNVAYAAKLLRLQEERSKQTGPGGLMHFVRYMWPVLEPSRPFIDGWVPQAIAEHLEAITFGEITRLLINVPPGSMKPICVDEPIMTDHGFVPLKNICVGDRVLTHRGRFREVITIHDQGVLPLVKIITQNGRSVRAAPDHPFLTPRGWVKAGDLSDQDYVGVPHISEPFGDRSMTPEEARMLGYLVGDGCISQRSLSYVSADQECIEDFIACAKACGFHAYMTVHPNPNAKAKKIVLKSTNGHFGRKVRCRETGEVFENLVAAARVLGCSVSSVAQSARTGGKVFKNARSKGLSFVRDGDGKSIRCVETKEVFDSASAAARSYGTDRKSIERVIRVGAKLRKNSLSQPLSFESLDEDREPPVLRWLRKYDLYRSNSYTKRIPDAVFRSGPEALANFVGAYWSCDGTIAIRHQNKKTTMVASATTVSKELAEDLQRALMCLGITSRVRRHEVNMKSKRQGDTYVSWQVINSARNEVAKMAMLPGLLTRKRELAERAFFDRFPQSIYEDAVVSVSLDGYGDCRCLTVDEDASFTVNGLIVHNSLMSNTFYPAWEWGPMNLPHLRTLSFSYSAHLTERDNDKFRTLITSKPYQELWGDRFKLTGDAKIKVSNDHMGWKLASSVKGVSTGERSDKILADDLHNVIEGESERVRSETVRWFKESMSNRLNDMDKSAIIVIMQRVHDLDVSGVITEDPQGMGYEHLCIPMRYEVDGPWSKSTSIGWHDPRTVDGELAWPERFSAQVVENLERDLGPFAFSSQMQQNPAPRGGGIIRRNWFRLWENPQNKFPPFDNVVAAVDPAYTEKDENDPSAMAIFATFRHPETNEFGIMLVHCWRKRLPIHGDTSPRFPGESIKAYERRCGDAWGLVEWIWHCCDAYGVQQLFIEGKASGLSVLQEIERRQVFRPWACDIDTGKGGGDKVSRLTAVQPLFSQGLIWAPDRDWASMFIDELAGFPKGKYDDLVDCASSALKKMREMGLIQHTDEREYEEYFEKNQPLATQPLYPV